MKAFVVVGCKTGDLCSVLPIIYHEFKRTGYSQLVIVAEEYASLLEGCSYILADIWQGDWQNLKSAIKYAKEKYQEVVVLSTFGKDWPLQKETPSFQLDQFKRAGEISNFDQIQLIFDKRNPAREATLVAQCGVDSGTVLCCGHGNSSPFQGASILEFVQAAFPTHRVLDLSKIKGERFYDLLGLYDKAACLVSIETSHLHLSKASNVPVVALVTDRPEIWHGSAWSKHFVAHIRYSDFEMKKPEIIQAIQDAIDKKSKPEIKIVTKEGYNPSIIDFNGERLMAFRYHPDSTLWRTQLAMMDSKGAITKIEPPVGFEDYSLEDSRAFTFKGKLMISYTVGRTVAIDGHNMHRCVIQYGELVNTGQHWEIKHAKQIKYGKNDFTAMEKNWSFWEHDGRLYCAYQRAPEQIILEIEGDKVVKEHRTKTPTCSFGTPRGGTSPILYQDGLIQFFHSQLINRKSAWWWSYYVGALIMEPHPPFQVIKISKHPVLIGNEQYFPNWKFWKPRICIPYGAIKSGDNFEVSIGVNDSASAIAVVKPEHLNL